MNIFSKCGYFLIQAREIIDSVQRITFSTLTFKADINFFSNFDNKKQPDSSNRRTDKVFRGRTWDLLHKRRAIGKATA